MNEVLSCCDCTHVEVISRDNPIKLADLYLCPKLIDADCVLGAKIWAFGSVGMVLIFQSSPGFSTVASVPTVSRYRFRYLSSGSYCWIPRCRFNVFRGLFCILLILVLVRFHFGSILISNQVEPKALVTEC